MMPTARPSSTTRSSISVRGNICDRAGADLALERLVGAEQELLAGLAAGVEGARHLGAAERAVVEQAAVLAGEGHALGHALVDDVDRQLGEAVDVGLAGAEVAALDRVVEQPEDAVAVVVVVLGGVDAALGGDRVGAARAVLEAEALHVVAELAEAGRGRGAGQAGAHHQDGELALVVRVDQLQVVAVLQPLGLQRTGGDLAQSREPIIAGSLLADQAGQHGQRERDVAEGDRARRSRGRSQLAPGVEPRMVPAQRLEQAPEAVVEVEPERDLRHDVEQRHPPDAGSRPPGSGRACALLEARGGPCPW